MKTCTYREDCGRERPDFVFDSKGRCDFCRRNEDQDKASRVRKRGPSKKTTLLDLRAERDRRIALTDWTQVSDLPQETRDKWRPYRKALRQVPNVYKRTGKIVWPSPPE